MSVQLMAGTMSLYADDVMFYRIIRSAIDYHTLQIDIDSLCRWTDSNLLTFNATKCKYMIVSRKKQPTHPSTPIMIKGTSLECVTSYKYLGVWLTSTLNWSLQVMEVCKKARQQLGALYRRFYGHISPDTFCCSIWHTYVLTLSMQQWYGTLTNMVWRSPSRTSKSLHSGPVLETGKPDMIHYRKNARYLLWLSVSNSWSSVSCIRLLTNLLCSQLNLSRDEPCPGA